MRSFRPRLAKAQCILGLKRPALNGCVEEDQAAVRVRWLQAEQVIQVAHGFGRLALEALGQQDALDGVQPAIRPGLQILAQVLLKQPAVQERFVLLVSQVRPDHSLEEGRVLFRQEEMELVTGELRIQRPFFLGLELRPGEQKRELRELRIPGKRRIQAVDP